MKPYYEDATVTIYNGDVGDVLRSLDADSIDAVLTDPPFSSGARQDAGKALRGAMLRGAKWSDDWFSHDNLSTVGFMFLMRTLAFDLRRVTKPGGTGQFFIDWRMYPHLFGALESANWRVRNLVVWDKQHFGMGDNYRSQHEFVIYAQKDGTTEFRRHDIGNVVRVKREPGEYHPTQKPTALLTTLASTVTDRGDVILDPFMGSGSTLVAAREIGRRSVGIEVEEKFCEVAATRLSQEVLDLGIAA